MSAVTRTVERFTTTKFIPKVEVENVEVFDVALNESELRHIITALYVAHQTEDAKLPFPLYSGERAQIKALYWELERGLTAARRATLKGSLV